MTDLAGLGDEDGRFGKRVKILNCGREAWEVYGTRQDVMVLTPDQRSAVRRWLADAGECPRWWPGWPGQ